MGVSLTDRVTFATMNVFGRNLNGIAKVTDRTGRDHYGNHTVMVMIGKNVKPGVFGGVIAATERHLRPRATSTRRRARQVTGGDIPATKTHASAVRTLGAALGIPDASRPATTPPVRAARSSPAPSRTCPAEP